MHPCACKHPRAHTCTLCMHTYTLMHIPMCTHTHVHTCTPTHTCTHAHSALRHMCMHRHTPTHTCTHVHTVHSGTCACTGTYTHTYTHARTHAHIYTCTLLSFEARLHAWSSSSDTLQAQGSGPVRKTASRGQLSYNTQGVCVYTHKTTHFPSQHDQSVSRTDFGFLTSTETQVGFQLPHQRRHSGGLRPPIEGGLLLAHLERSSGSGDRS